MSFFQSHLSRLTTNQPQSEYETTEMTHIVDLDPIMTLMDGRNSLSNILPEEDDTNDSTSLSSQSTHSEQMANGVKYNYNEDEEENPFIGDEAEQSLVSNRHDDIETGTVGLMKKVQKKTLVFCS
jgi:hypothetical protein